MVPNNGITFGAWWCVRCTSAFTIEQVDGGPKAIRNEEAKVIQFRNRTKR